MLRDCCWRGKTDCRRKVTKLTRSWPVHWATSRTQAVLITDTRTHFPGSFKSPCQIPFLMNEQGIETSRNPAFSRPRNTILANLKSCWVREANRPHNTHTGWGPRLLLTPTALEPGFHQFHISVSIPWISCKKEQNATAMQSCFLWVPRALDDLASTRNSARRYY